jgi:hypothetical protein
MVIVFIALYTSICRRARVWEIRYNHAIFLRTFMGIFFFSQDKTEALRIDIDQLELTERSTGLSHKPDPTRVPNASIQPEAWHDHSVQNRADAEMEMAKSQRLRENIFHAIEQTTNDLKVQTDATNFEFRKRIYEMKRAKEELEYQMRKVGIVNLTN